MRNFCQSLGSVIFTLYLFLSLPVYAVISLLTAPLPHRVTYIVGRHWVKTVLFLLKTLCSLDYVVEGQQHLPKKNTVVLLKHSSTFEGLAQVLIFPRQTWVIKKELMWAPFLGWALPLYKPIAINRRAGRTAMEQVIEKGQQRLNEGLWVMIFPEGTRVASGESKRYGLGGAFLAAAAGRPIVPVAHNAGKFWPRRSWIKQPGTITIRIGPPISTEGLSPQDITDQVREWIESAVKKINAPMGAGDANHKPHTPT